MKKRHKPLLILLTLLSLFFAYNIKIYTDKSNYGDIHLSEKAIRGENLWLKNNCNSCHQIYGLGGYLGPDLTNVCSTKGKGENYIKAMLNSGVKAMPKFNFNDTEKEAIVQFFKEIDKTGYYPNITAKVETNGWVAVKYKKEVYEK